MLFPRSQVSRSLRQAQYDRSVSGKHDPRRRAALTPSTYQFPRRLSLEMMPMTIPWSVPSSVLWSSPSQSAIVTLTGFSCDTIQCLLKLVQSLLVLHADSDDPVQPFHRSFPNSITDLIRCTDLQFHTSPAIMPSLSYAASKFWSCHGGPKPQFDSECFRQAWARCTIDCA